MISLLCRGSLPTLSITDLEESMLGLGDFVLLILGEILGPCTFQANHLVGTELLSHL